MVRLIDADAIPYTEYDVSYGDGMYDTANGVYESEIDAMPTIDAIPIEYIRKWVLAQGYGRKQGWLITLRNLENLIKDWEAEKNV